MLMVFAAMAALADPPPAAATDAGPPIVDVEFARLSGAERAYRQLGPVGPYYPDRAARAGVQGAAVLECRAGPAGALEDCRVLGVKPADLGFDKASLIMAQRRRIRAPGPPAEGQTVRVRVPFVLGAPAKSER